MTDAAELTLLLAMLAHPMSKTKTIPVELHQAMERLANLELVAQRGGFASTPYSGWYITQAGVEVTRRLARALPTHARMVQSRLRVVESK